MTDAPQPTVRPRVFVVEDHTLVREGLGRLLDGQVDVVGTAGDGRSLLAAVDAARPDLVLLDISLPQLNGLDTARQLRRTHPDVRVIFVTMHAEPDYVDAARQTGAAGYVVKSDAPAELLDAIAAVMAGGTYLSPRVAPPAGPGPVDPLTLRQREVLQLVAEGRKAHEIAEILGLSRKTVEFHKASIMRVLGLHSTAELTRHARKLGLVGPT
jgi:DNA-binding NarL/FixJ family response regulator